MMLIPNDRPHFHIDQLPCSLLVTTGCDQKLTFANQAAAELWGDLLILGQTLESHGEGHKLSQIFNLIKATYIRAQSVTSEDISVQNVGSAKGAGIFEVHCRPIYGENGCVTGVITSIIDITRHAQKKYEAEEANKAKSNFMAQLSHEIRSPLSAIIEHCEIFREAENRESHIEHFVSSVERNSHHILNLVNEILDLAKVESGKIVIEKTPFSITELLADIETEMQSRAAHRGLKFQLKINAGVPEILSSDPKLLRQVLNNVLSNALKFTRQGSISLWVDHQADCLEFTVQDTGEGISEEKQLVIFEEFEQADPSIAQRFGGTGLGLAITKKILEKMGGSIVLQQSSPRNGSTFLMRVPAQPETETFRTRRRRTQLTDTFVLKGMRVLVVDDASDNQFIFNNFLSHAGAESKVASNGKEALDILSHQSFDAVLMDIGMPVMDGIEATHILRSQGFTQPIIALTAHAMSGERNRALEAGFTDYITKPVTREHLIGLVHKYLH